MITDEIKIQEQTLEKILISFRVVRFHESDDEEVEQQQDFLEVLNDIFDHFLIFLRELKPLQPDCSN